jgi:hypothetical protein
MEKENSSFAIRKVTIFWTSASAAPDLSVVSSLAAAPEPGAKPFEDAALRVTPCHNDALPLVELHNSFKVVRTCPTNGRGWRFNFASQYACHLFDAVHTQAGLDTIDIDDQDAGAVGLFRSLHAKASTHVDDRKDNSTQIGYAIDVSWRARNFRHLGKANDFLY